MKNLCLKNDLGMKKASVVMIQKIMNRIRLARGFHSMFNEGFNLWK
jgi:hypothetical protein